MLSEAEIETYREFVEEVRTEFTRKEIQMVGAGPLTKEAKKALGIED